MIKHIKSIISCWSVIVLFVQLLGCSLHTYAKISPFQYGYSEARTGEERYEVLYRTHCEALKTGANVDYSGLKNIELTIPSNAKSIPLTNINDFSGVVITVTNNSRDVFLFQKVCPLEMIKVTKRMISKGFYPTVREKTHGEVLLLIEDGTPWVDNRKGYNYAVFRKDAIIIKNGKAKNKPIYPYCSKQSNPIAYYRILDGEGTAFGNLIFNRSEKSTYKTFLMKVNNEDHITIENVEINTPQNTFLTADAIFCIGNSTNICFKNVTINNTYSNLSSYGYGVNLENVTNVQFDCFSGFGEWGVFGNNNVNTVSFKNSKLNRFDIHCYGRDVTFENCIFFDLYNQFSSFYGKLVFNSCTFNNFVPVSLEMSYNAYTYFDVYFKNCIINTTSNSHALVSAGRIDEVGGGREELSALCWPNVYVKDMTVNAGYAANPFYIYVCGGKEQRRSIDYLSKVTIDGLTYYATDSISHIRSISLCNKKNIETSNILKMSFFNIVLANGINKETIHFNSPDGKMYLNFTHDKGKQHKLKVRNSDMYIVDTNDKSK